MSVYEITRNRPVPLGSVGIFTVVSGAERAGPAPARLARPPRHRGASCAA